MVFENGITTNNAMYGTSTTAGASENTQESAARGMTSSFWISLIPSAMGWPTPWKRPAYIGPNRCCMWAMILSSE
jgi:hypothetical protein